jgi:hypothetical protein
MHLYSLMETSHPEPHISHKVLDQETSHKRPESEFGSGQTINSPIVSQLYDSKSRSHEEYLAGFKRSASVLNATQIQQLANRRTSLPPNSLCGSSGLNYDPQSSGSLCLPPKRDLPFPQGRQISRTPTANLPPLPTPTPVVRRKSISEDETTPKSLKMHLHSSDQTTRQTLDLERSKADHPSVGISEHVLTLETTPETLGGESLTKQISFRAATIPAEEYPQPTLPISNDNNQRAKDRHKRTIGCGEEPITPAEELAVLKRPSTAPGLQIKATTTRKRPVTPMVEYVLPPRKVAKMTIDSCTQTETNSGRPHTTGCLPISEKYSRKTHATPSFALSTHDRFTQSPLEDLPLQCLTDSNFDGVSNFVSRNLQKLPPQEIWDRPGWESGTPEERQKIVDDFMLDLLEDEHFAQLCEHVSNSWARICLGAT